MALNVNRAVTDPFYRYKMPKLQAKVEGKGNGIKTVIANMADIAKALKLPPMYPTKYFGCELGAQTNFDAKNERYIVNGEHDAAKLQDILDGFIKKFVLCPACNYPETVVFVCRNEINSKCKACGHAFIIDNRHRLATFILRNPPKKEVDISRAEENNHAKDKEKDDDDDSSGGKKSSNDDDDDWAPEPVVDSDKLAAGIGKLVLDTDLKKNREERLDMLHNFFIKAKQNDTIGSGKELADEAERLDLKQKAPLLLADVLLDENIMKEAQLKTYRRVLLRFALNDKKAQRYMLGGIEQLIVKHENLMAKGVPHIIKALYDTDIVEEESNLAWAEKPSSKYVTKTQARLIIGKAAPVLEWLRDAEEEEEESEVDDVIQFNNKEGLTGKYIEQAKIEAQKDDVKVEVDGEEINIDDI